MKQNRANKWKDRRSSGCGLCKPYKHGGAPRFKETERRDRAQEEDEALEFMGMRVVLDPDMPEDQVELRSSVDRVRFLIEE